jgi:Leucine-rich repeat (LRR) protein
MDKDDRQQNLVTLLNGPMEELKDFFKSEFAKGLTVGNGTKFVIDSFTHGAVGTYIALYGMDDLIVSLPESLEEFQIQNKGNQDIMITIPEEIGKFKNLRMIFFENCISSIPNSICDLPKLELVALVNNPKLTSIPDCIVNLPKLEFMNLSGSNNLKIPEGLRDKMDELGGGMWTIN